MDETAREEAELTYFIPNPDPRTSTIIIPYGNDAANQSSSQSNLHPNLHAGASSIVLDGGKQASSCDNNLDVILSFRLHIPFTPNRRVTLTFLPTIHCRCPLSILQTLTPGPPAHVSLRDPLSNNHLDKPEPPPTQRLARITDHSLFRPSEICDQSIGTLALLSRGSLSGSRSHTPDRDHGNADSSPMHWSKERIRE